MELTINQALQQGVEAHKAGKLQDAERLYRAILQSQPQHPDANHNLGVLAVSVGKAEVALPLFKAALEANQSAAQFWLSYIDVLIKLDRLPEAKAVFDQARVKGVQGESLDRLERLLSQKTQAESPELNNSLLDTAIELKENGKFDQAIDLLQTGANQFPQDPNILALLSYCYILTDSLKEAVDYHDKAKSLAPDSASVGWNEVRLLLKRNDISKAVVTARSINKRFPDDIEGMGILGTCLRASNDIEESLLYLDKALSLDPTFAEALINRGLIRLTQNAKIEALADLEEAHKLKPHIKQIWDLVIGLKMEFEQFAEAILLLAVMTEIDPDNEQIFSNLGLCHQFLGELEEAVAAYKKAISLKPDYAMVYNNMGNILKEQGKLDQAIEAYKKTISLKHDSAVAYSNMGNALKDQAKLEESVQAHKKAILLEPDYFDAHNNIGNTYKEQGRLEEAVQAYKKAISLQPDNIAAHNNLGFALEEQGKLEDAIKCFDLVGNSTAVAKALECTYFLEQYDDFNERLKVIANADPENLRVAAMSAFAAHQLQQKDPYPFCENPIELVKFSHLKKHVSDSNAFIASILNEIKEVNSVWEPRNQATKAGFQTSNKLFSNPRENMKILKDIIRKELDLFRSEYKNSESTLIQNWPDEVKIAAWYVRMLQGGHQDSHIHPNGWVSGVLYLKTVELPTRNEGAIEFSLQGYDYPIKDEDYPQHLYQPKNGDLVLFPSSLFHKTIPVIQDVERCVIAFDLIRPN